METIKMLSKHSEISSKGNILKRGETLAKAMTSGNTKELGIVIKDKFLNILLIILCVIDGKFGRLTLKSQYRKPWQFITYGTLIILFLIYVLIPLLDWWQGIVNYINYMRWGI